MQRGKGYIFRLYFPLWDNYLCDINNDGKLDFLLPEYLHSDTELGSDTGITAIAFLPYTIEDNGRFERLADHHGVQCFLTATFKSLWAPREFQIIGTNCSELCPWCR